MRFALTPAAAAYVRAHGGTLTIASLIVSSCCGLPMPPEVKPGPPPDTDGFRHLEQDGLTIWFDGLLEPRPVVEIDLQDYGKFQELAVQNWQL